MTTKKIQIIPPGYVDILHPETDSDSVIMSDGNKLETKADVTYYVAPTGLDVNNGLTAGNPFKTIQHAIDGLPQIINHVVNIQVTNGNYSTENLLIEGHTGRGELNFKGSSADPTLLTIMSYTDNKNSIKITLDGFKAMTTVTNAFTKRYPGLLNILNCNTMGSCAFAGVWSSTGGIVVVGNTIISNKISALSTSTGGVIASTNNTGATNTRVVTASDGGIVNLSGTQPTGLNPNSMNSGGQINESIAVALLATNGYRWNNDGSLEQWGTAIGVTNTGKSITFPIPFPNSAFNLTATSKNTNSAVSCPNLLKATAQLYVTVATATDVMYRAIGN